MIRFNDNHIVVGYIKQLLKDFNLPKFKIFTDDANTIDSTDTARVRYIKDGVIQERSNGSWQKITELGCYTYNVPVLNFTRNLVINSTNYDSYTHEYLGDYLRFQRDYNKIDLMPLYNCFSDRLCQNVKLGQYIDTTNKNYKVYTVPVRLFKTYTIAIECDSPIELACGLYNDYIIDTDLSDKLANATYTKKSNTMFNRPFTFKLELNEDAAEGITEDALAKIALHEQDLKLFLKIPAENKSAITILEGDYTSWNDSILFGGDESVNDTRKSNTYITNFCTSDRLDVDYAKMKEDGDTTHVLSRDENFNVFKPITRLQLLDKNLKTSIPFANKLIGYLCGNTITPLDAIEDDFARAQAVADIDDGFDVEGVWDNKLQILFYEYMKNTGKVTNYTTSLDVLGYVDKDVEKYYASKNGALESVDIYPDIYKDNKTKGSD